MVQKQGLMYYSFSPQWSQEETAKNAAGKTPLRKVLPLTKRWQIRYPPSNRIDAPRLLAFMRLRSRAKRQNSYLRDGLLCFFCICFWLLSYFPSMSSPNSFGVQDDNLPATPPFPSSERRGFLADCGRLLRNGSSAFHTCILQPSNSFYFCHISSIKLLHLP